MKKTLAYFILFFGLLSVFLLPQKSFAIEYNFEKIFYMSQGKEKEGIESLKKNSDKIDILAPQFYGVSANLKLVGSINSKLQKVIDDKKVKVMPLVTNAGFKQSVIHNLLVSPKAQDAVIKSLVDLAKKNKYIGWQYDFENISYLDKDLYSIFIEKTAKSLKEKGLILSVAAVSRTVDYENTDAFKNWGGVFDYARIAKAVNFISLMTYDDPSSVGPVASLAYVNNVLNYVKDKIPPEKLSLGIPLYNWGWRIDPFKKITANGTYKGLLYIKSNFTHNLGFDSTLGSSWLSYFYLNKQYKIWYQDSQSFKNKLDIVEKNNFRGFSAWVLGVENPAIWGVLSK